MDDRINTNEHFTDFDATYVYPVTYTMCGKMIQ